MLIFSFEYPSTSFYNLTIFLYTYYNSSRNLAAFLSFQISNYFKKDSLDYSRSILASYVFLSSYRMALSNLLVCGGMMLSLCTKSSMELIAL